ncbi:hypothetical protein Ssi02_54970 [Sinosporangium siamense]|uniref:Major facilitator superfamily (MFS) profile domain-containing protein n=2 Tax=Sinosporangium siamense TaxID=1367973 RepID=A0A919V9G1_9ACTN|nr:hypothetical protein Ssi02_54970 [Sinosporangium siamense]
MTAGLAYLPYGGGLLVGIWCSSRVSARFGVRPTLVVSFLVCAAGLLLLARAGAGPGGGSVAGVLPGLLVTSLGCGLTLPALTVAAVTSTTGENAGLGSAVLTSVQQIGGAVGVAVLVSVAARHERAAGAGSASVAAALLALGALVVAALPRSGRGLTGALAVLRRTPYGAHRNAARSAISPGHAQPYVRLASAYQVTGSRCTP